MTRRFRVRRSGPLRGALRVPGDKSVGHRTLFFGALAEGRSHVSGLSGGLDNLSTAQILRDMGVAIRIEDDRAEIDGVGLDGLRIPKGDLDCGNSGTTMRLMAGLLVAQRFGTRLIGDESLTRRPMRRVVEPLRARGGHIAGRSGKKPGEVYPPLAVAPLVEGEELSALDYASPIASAQVKSALLLSGLYASGPTSVAEPVVSRDHTERMMVALGVPLSTTGSHVVLDPRAWERKWSGFEWEVPGDLSSAAFVIAAALLVPGSEVRIERVGINPTRTGILDALRAMRADVTVVPKGDVAGAEPIGDVIVRHGRIGPGRTGGELLTRMIDEVPAFCAIGVAAQGRTDVRDAEELRGKESDRIAASARVLRAFGADCTELADGVHVHGPTELGGAEVASEGDHRIAMMAAVLGLASEGESVVDDVACVDTSFPGFASLLASLGASIEVEDA
ncbi:MAG: 3-phosphoshikimate 1-carboxyvinyltransferase [Sandaracinaceae bacterium]|nr:3-phosphoshikimate 1-carboxyvinyltransferase [Sandaracinaceae bacterium]